MNNESLITKESIDAYIKEHDDFITKRNDMFLSKEDREEIYKYLLRLKENKK
jgi:hypothetical protein